jgi:hypothetical protein
MKFAVVAALLAAAAPPVEVTQLSGDQQSGALLKLTAKELVLQPESGPAVTIPTADLLEVRRAGEPAASTNADVPAVRLGLVDGSQLQVTNLATTAKSLSGKHPLLGDVTLPLAAVHSVRFSAPSAKFDPLWAQLLEKGSKSDLVVLQKAEVLDHLDGVVGAIDDAAIKFLLDGDEISVKREKAFGLIYARRPANAKLAGRAILSNGDFLALKSVAAENDRWQLDSAAGPSWTLDAAGISAVDFSLGKVVYLSTLEPRDVKYKGFIEEDGNDFFWKFRKDRSLEGKPLRLGQKTYARGLAIHSKTELRYRLGGEYRRLQALMGIDDEITNTRFGTVVFRILGDRNQLFAGEFRPRQPPIPLDLDVTGVVDLDLLVDWGSDTDIGDRLHLADARIVK